MYSNSINEQKSIGSTSILLFDKLIRFKCERFFIFESILSILFESKKIFQWKITFRDIQGNDLILHHAKRFYM